MTEYEILFMINKFEWKKIHLFIWHSRLPYNSTYTIINILLVSYPLIQHKLMRGEVIIDN